MDRCGFLERPEFPYGHATSQEIVAVKLVEERFRADPRSAEAALDLVQVYLEPCHRERDAVELLHQILASNPDHPTAKLWLAYCGVHVVMDDVALNEALQLVRSLQENANWLGLSRADHVGAALVLEEEILKDLHKDNRPSEWSAERQIALLEAAVAQTPTWVIPHYRLAYSYRDVGRSIDASREMQQAVRNCWPSEQNVDVRRLCWETHVTGHLYSRGELEEEFSKWK